MHILRHAPEVSAYIETQPQGDIPTLIQQRLEELLADDIDTMEALVFFVVLEPEDTQVDLEAVLGIPLHTPTGHPLWECLEAHPDCYEMVFVLDDSGYGAIVLVPNQSTTDQHLLTLCAHHCEEPMP